MNDLGHAWEQLRSGEAFSFSGVGLMVALVLLLALRFLLPRDELNKLRAPIGLLAGHLLFVVLAALALPDSGAHRVFRIAALLLVLVGIGRTGFLLCVDSILARRLARPIPKIFRDICEGLVYTAAALVVLRQAGAQLDALLTTSALLTAVIGLSLQDTLGNLFAGLSIQAQKPFEVGDWIQYDENPTTIGQVIEINWRATKVLTLDDVEIVIPNGPLARAPIRNFTKPTLMSRRNVHVVVPFPEPPHRVQQTILGALAHIPGVLAHPPPSVVTERFEERGTRYWIRYHTDDFQSREVTDGMVRDRVWYALRRAGIDFAVPVAELDVTHDDESSRKRIHIEALERRKAALRRVDFLGALDESQLAELAACARERQYGPGEMIIRRGEGGDEFFIVQHGEVSVVLDSEGEHVEVARLDTGSFFGEMSVMTGEPRTATVRSVTVTQLLVVDKAALQRILDASPDLAERISEVLAARREELSSASSKSRAPALPRAGGERRELLHRIKEFFSLSN